MEDIVSDESQKHKYTVGTSANFGDIAHIHELILGLVCFSNGIVLTATSFILSLMIIPHAGEKTPSPSRSLSAMATPISIVMPTLNAENYLPHLLTSFERQSTGPPKEVILVDSASDDHTIAVGKTFSFVQIVPIKREACIQSMPAIMSRSCSTHQALSVSGA